MSIKVNKEDVNVKEKKLCTKCNSPNAMNAHFCYKCRNPLTEEAKKKLRMSSRRSSQKRNSFKENKEDEKIKCTNCGLETHSNKKFCSKCGSEVIMATEIKKIIDNQLDLDLQIITEVDMDIDLEKMLEIENPVNNEKKKSGKTCPACNFQNTPTARFCRKCGGTFGGSQIMMNPNRKSTRDPNRKSIRETNPNRKSTRDPKRKSTRTSTRDLKIENEIKHDLKPEDDIKPSIPTKPELNPKLNPLKNKEILKVSRNSSSDKSIERTPCKKCSKLIPVNSKFCAGCGDSNPLSRASRDIESPRLSQDNTQKILDNSPPTKVIENTTITRISQENKTSVKSPRLLKKSVSILPVDESINVCDGCGALNKSGRKFCTQCGNTITLKISSPTLESILSSTPPTEKKDSLLKDSQVKDILNSTPPTPEKKTTTTVVHKDSPFPNTAVKKTVVKKTILKKLPSSHHLSDTKIEPINTKTETEISNNNVNKTNSSPFITTSRNSSEGHISSPPTQKMESKTLSSSSPLNPQLKKRTTTEPPALKRTTSLTKISTYKSKDIPTIPSPESPLTKRVVKKVVVRKSVGVDKLNDSSELEEKLEKERQEKERQEKEKLEQEKLEKERLEKERLEKERLEKERLEKEKLEKERIEKERLEQEELKEKERLEQERLEKERLEKERVEKERLEKERLEKERVERERLEKERLERERKEKERLEKLEKLRQEKLEKERIERERKEKLEKERLEKERIERERVEKERLERERKEKERMRLEKLRLEKLEKERLERERIEKERLEQERLELERLEKERLELERLEQERLEQERLEREIQEKLEKERLEQERLERARLRKEKIEKERQERERQRQERLEQERIEREKKELERQEKLKLEKEKLEKERLEIQRLEQERKLKLQQQKERIEKLRVEKEKNEKERLERERQERERLEQERLELERLEKERQELERLEKERHEQERLEKERLEQERLEQERLEKERLEQERLELERLEQERLEQERLELERLEQERLERERLEKERLEKERLELEKLKKERLEKERQERERIEKERLERERLEKERLEKERLEKERIERERQERERKEKERQERERQERERQEKERLEKERLENERLEKERVEKERLEKERLEKERTQTKKNKEECPSCKFENLIDDFFCGQCGENLRQHRMEKKRKEEMKLSINVVEDIVEPKANFRISYAEFKDGTLLDIFNAIDAGFLMETISEKKDVSNYFSQVDVVKKLLYYLFSEKPIQRNQYKPSRKSILDEQDDHMILFKVKIIVRDLFLNFDSEKVFETLTNNNELLMMLCSYLNKEKKEANTFFHFNKILYHIVDNAFHNFIVFFQSNKQLLEMLVDNICNIDVRKVMLMMLQKEANFVKYTPHLQWSKDSLIRALHNKLLDALNNDDEQLIHAVCEFIGISLNEVSQSHPYLSLEIQTLMLDLISKNLFSNYFRSFFYMVCSLIPYNPLKEKNISPEISEESDEDFFPVNDEIHFDQALVNFFTSKEIKNNIYKSLTEEVISPYNKKPLLGSKRWCVVEMVHKLITTSNEEIEISLVDNGSFGKLLDLFFRFQWNNILHTNIVNLLVYVFHNERTKSLKQFIFLEYQFHQKIVEHLQPQFSHLNDSSFDLDTYTLPTPKSGFLGHLIQLANEIDYCAQSNFFGEKISEYLGQDGDWQNFLCTTLNLINDTQKCSDDQSLDENDDNDDLDNEE